MDFQSIVVELRFSRTVPVLNFVYLRTIWILYLFQPLNKIINKLAFRRSGWAADTCGKVFFIRVSIIKCIGCAGFYFHAVGGKTIATALGYIHYSIFEI